jgi:hypothetical protein
MKITVGQLRRVIRETLEEMGMQRPISDYWDPRIQGALQGMKGDDEKLLAFIEAGGLGKEIDPTEQAIGVARRSLSTYGRPTHRGPHMDYTDEENPRLPGGGRRM